MSHAAAEYPYAGAVKVREPVARPLDVVAVELLLSASQAFLVGVLMYLAVGVWDDRGVGFGPVATILALLGLAIGGSWLYWLFGGVGWPLAAAATPAAMFLGFALVLGWFGTDLFRVAGAPLLLATLAAGYGIIGGVFINSPRRWRWDQRQKLRPGTRVPRVSPTTQALVAQLPRSLPRRATSSAPASELALRIGHSSSLGQPRTDDIAGDVTGTAVAAVTPEPAGDLPSPDARPPDAPPRAGGGAGTGAAADGEPPATERPAEAPASSSRPATVPRTNAAHERDGIELPTSVEPRAQRSPWAWAAPPEWTREEDDERPAAGSSKRS